LDLEYVLDLEYLPPDATGGSLSTA